MRLSRDGRQRPGLSLFGWHDVNVRRYGRGEDDACLCVCVSPESIYEEIAYRGEWLRYQERERKRGERMRDKYEEKERERKRVRKRKRKTRSRSVPG